MPDMFDEDLQDFEAEAFSNKKSGRIQTYHTSGHHANGRYVSCAESHKPMPVGGSFIYGGACGWPIVKDADIYIGLDGSMNFRGGTNYPWNPPSANGPVEVLFRITDGQAPKDPDEFKRMIHWLADQLKAGKKIHVGCIGGHGRTGMVLAALVKVVDGIEDAITYVRENYCPKVVESNVQVQFLHKHFGIKPVIASRSVHVSHVHGSGKVTSGRHLKSAAEVGLLENMTERQKALYAEVHQTKGVGASHRPALLQGPFDAVPCASITSIWGKGAKARHAKVAKPGKPAMMEPSQEGA